ncbi:MAG: acyltransferase domain-containing protein [Anaerocolumna sp.]
MVSKQDFIKHMMEKIEFPQEAQEAYVSLCRQLERVTAYREKFTELADRYMRGETDSVYEEVDILAETMKVHSYTMSMMLFLWCGEALLEEYREEDIPEGIYWDSMYDLHCKLMECYQVYGIWGTFVRSWYPGFYQMTRFALGRLQYEYSDFKLDEYEVDGNIVKKGDRVINMHIPSNGSFSEEKRLESYKRAFEFYIDDFGGKPIPMVCESWLLYPEHREFLPEHLNIRSFMEDFTYIEGAAEDKFENAWRVFGKDSTKAPNELPQETSLQGAYAKHLMAGGKTGSGYGVFFFDGEKIIRTRKILH